MTAENNGAGCRADAGSRRRFNEAAASDRGKPVHLAVDLPPALPLQ